MNTVYSLFRNANVISVTVFSKLSETFNPSFAGSPSLPRQFRWPKPAPLPFSLSFSSCSCFCFCFLLPPHHPAHGHLIHHFHHVFHLVELLYKSIDLGYVLP